MKFQFFLPDILDFPTGGNIFNQHFMQQLARSHEVDQIIVSPKKKVNIPDTVELETDTCWLIDSLLTGHQELIKSIADINISYGKWLLVHYLNMLDPAHASGPDTDEERKNLAHFDGYIVTSRYSKNQLMNNGIPARNIVVIQPGINERFLVRRKPRIVVQLLTVSSIFPGKGLLEFLKVLENLSDLPWQWILIGADELDPEFTAEFLRHIGSSRLKNRIQILGPLSQVSLFQIYKQSDIFVLNSRFESCSMVTMEAMSFGLAILANEVGGLPELVQSQENGYLVPPGDRDQFSEVLRKLISKPDLRISLGEKAFHSSRSFPSWPQCAKKFLKFLESHPTPQT
ncbi:MAG: glycosyltransferase family 4 protein [bacterium]|nr:MAG: glycosyltransferase family 4 protein [bacterium]